METKRDREMLEDDGFMFIFDKLSADEQKKVLEMSPKE